MTNKEVPSVNCPVDGHKCTRKGCRENYLVPVGLDCDKAVVEIVDVFTRRVKRKEQDLNEILIGTNYVIDITAKTLEVNEKAFHNEIKQNILARAIKNPPAEE